MKKQALVRNLTCIIISFFILNSCKQDVEIIPVCNDPEAMNYLERQYYVHEICLCVYQHEDIYRTIEDKYIEWFNPGPERHFLDTILGDTLTFLLTEEVFDTSVFQDSLHVDGKCYWADFYVERIRYVLKETNSDLAIVIEFRMNYSIRTDVPYGSINVYNGDLSNPENGFCWAFFDADELEEVPDYLDITIASHQFINVYKIGSCRIDNVPEYESYLYSKEHGLVRFFNYVSID